MALRAGLLWELPASYRLHRRTAGEGRDVVTSVEDVSLESLDVMGRSPAAASSAWTPSRAVVPSVLGSQRHMQKRKNDPANQ